MTEYAFSGDFLQTYYIQYDVKLLESIEEIRNDFSLLSEYAFEYKELRPDERVFYRELFQKITTKIPKVQEIISKRLEGL